MEDPYKYIAIHKYLSSLPPWCKFITINRDVDVILMQFCRRYLFYNDLASNFRD